jgi:3-oxoacyl-[acyl-carrier-protein] synthase II
MMQRVHITGVGVVSSIGMGRAEFFRALAEGKSGITQVESFDAHPLGREYAGEVKNFHPKDHLTAAEVRRMGRCSAMTLAAARMAVEDAGIAPELLSGTRTAVVIGTTMGEAGVIADLDHGWIAHGPKGLKRSLLPKYGSTLLPIHVARALGAAGMVLTLPAACAAGTSFAAVERTSSSPAPSSSFRSSSSAASYASPPWHHRGVSLST